ncbi:hypothetical protein LRH25_09180 [Ideonella azotifigens]|nr:hypothetical protein [Ideonella azotifigens]MCD2340515.1 hypothetical protein [Ideonella azotifigens]
MTQRNSPTPGAPQQTGGGGYGFDNSMRHRQTEDGETMGSPAANPPRQQQVEAAPTAPAEQAGLTEADAQPGGVPKAS